MTGAPCNVAATPPTTTKSTLWPANTLRIPSKSVGCTPLSEPGDGVDRVLEDAESLRGAQTQEPSNQGHVHTVLSFAGPTVPADGKGGGPPI